MGLRVNSYSHNNLYAYDYNKAYKEYVNVSKMLKKAQASGVDKNSECYKRLDNEVSNLNREVKKYSQKADAYEEKLQYSSKENNFGIGNTINYLA